MSKPSFYLLYFPTERLLEIRQMYHNSNRRVQQKLNDPYYKEDSEIARLVQTHEENLDCIRNLDAAILVHCK